jgi:hypothetical protein
LNLLSRYVHPIFICRRRKLEMKFSKLFGFAVVALAAVVCSTPELDAQGREGQGQGRGAGQGQGRGQQGRGQQGRGGGIGGSRGGSTSLLGLCSIEAVQKEIDLVDEQKTDLDKLRTSQREARGDRTGGVDFRALRELPEEERNAKMAELREKSAADRAKREKAENAKVAEILLPPQLARVKEIRIQMMGLRALSDQEVIAALKITAAQQKQIKEIPEKAQEASREKMREAFSNLRDLSREERTEAFTKFRSQAETQQKEVETKVLAVLSGKQKTDFGAMKGKAFKMPERQRGAQGRGTQGRGTQGRGTQGRGTGGRGGDAPSRGTQGRGTGGRGGDAAPSRGTQGRDNPAPEKKDEN